jgi:hypothetical protein
MFTLKRIAISLAVVALAVFSAYLITDPLELYDRLTNQPRRVRGLVWVGNPATFQVEGGCSIPPSTIPPIAPTLYNPADKDALPPTGECIKLLNEAVALNPTDYNRAMQMRFGVWMMKGWSMKNIDPHTP